MKRENDVSLLKDIINKVITNNNLTYGLDKIQIKDVWKKIAGESILRYTDEVRLQGTTLIIKINSASLKENLSLGKSKIVDQINEEFEKEVIKDIIFL